MAQRALSSRQIKLVKEGRKITGGPCGPSTSDEPNPRPGSGCGLRTLQGAWLGVALCRQNSKAWPHLLRAAQALSGSTAQGAMAQPQADRDRQAGASRLPVDTEPSHLLYRGCEHKNIRRPISGLWMRLRCVPSPGARPTGYHGEVVVGLRKG